STSLGRSIIEGWKFSWHNKAVRTSLLVVMFASLFIVPFTTLLPVFARDILDVGVTGQGLLLTAMGVGALGSAIIIAFFGDRMPRGIFMLGGVGLYGLSVVAFAASPWFELSMALMVLSQDLPLVITRDDSDSGSDDDAILSFLLTLSDPHGDDA